MAPPPPRDQRTANEVLQHASILHGTFLERLKTTNVNGVVGFLNRDVFPEMVEKLQMRLDRIRSRGFDSGPWTTKRYKDMVARMGASVTEGMNGAHKMLRKELRDLSITEAEWQIARLKQAVGPISVDFVMPSKPLLRSIVDGRPLQGLNLKGWFRDLSKSTKSAIAKQVGIGMAVGETTPQIIQRIRGTRALGFTDGVLQATRRQAESIVRTSISHVATQAAEDTFKESTVVKGVMWVSTLDADTCPVCANLDGEVFNKGEGIRPPDPHPRCRCRTTPILKSWKEMGINLKELKPSTRASMNGQVPQTLKYPQWLKKQSVEVQNQVLGKGKAKLWRSGKVKIKDFVDNRNRPLSLAQVRKLEGLPVPAPL